ncbi:MAG: cation:proton antiporter [Clostridiales bacterium]|jgi:Kef-type K+ transport system membrane component KefB|nr:cation:proton antiporter [Clostridiales bacterium]
MLNNQALVIALLLFGGLLLSILFRRFRIPSVSAYIFLGLILSPSLLNIIPGNVTKELVIIKTLGLGFIAFIVGGELKLDRIQSLRKSILYMTGLLSSVTFLFVFLAMYFVIRLPLPVALLLGATSTTTAPAPPVTVMRELRARGPFTTTLLGTVAMADAAAILLFGLISAVVSTLLAGGQGTIMSALQYSAIELLGSLALGSLVALCIAILFTKYDAGKYSLVIMLGTILLVIGISEIAHFSPLLANLICGFTFANLYNKADFVLSSLDPVEAPLFIAFFALAGTTLQLGVLVANWPIALTYIIMRSVGILVGVGLGARLSNAGENIRRYLGSAVLSKAGVTIGLVMLVQTRFPEIAGIVTAVEFAAIAFFEIIGPILTRNAIIKSGEAQTT